MADQFPRLEARHRAFIERQHIFFTGSADRDGRVNISPKGLDALRVLSDGSVVYLDRTGSGNETSAHLKATGRMTIMFCALEGPPLILRLYGEGRVVKRGADEYAAILAAKFDGKEAHGARQMIVLDFDLVQTSCGFGVPHHEYKGERPSMPAWAGKRTEEELEAYRQEKNILSIDGKPTGLLDDEVVAAE